MPASSEMVAPRPTALSDREKPLVDVRRVLELRATLQAQDDQLLLDAVRGGYVERVEESVRLCPTGQTDELDNSPVFASVGARESPDDVLSPMTGAAFTLRHRSVTGPGVAGHQLVAPERAALPAGFSPPVTEEEE